MKHVLSAAGVAACTLVLCTACVGSSSPSGITGNTTSAPHATSSTASATPGAGTSTTTSTSTGTANGSAANSTTTATAAGNGNGNGGGSGASTCSVRYLNGTVGGEQGTAGSIYVNVIFKNLNNQPCTLDGYPGVSFGAGTPVNQVGQPADRNPQVNPQLVTLQPGGYAHAVLQIGDAGNWPASTCQPTPTTYLQVYPPNTSNLLYVAYNSTGCKGNVVTLHVEAVQPGTGS